MTVWRAAADELAIDFGSESVLAWTQAFEHSLTRAGLQLVAGWQPDVIHAHDWLVAQTAHTLRQVTGSPVVVTVHATEHGRQQGWLAEPVARAIHSAERWLCRDATAVITCSRFMAGEVGRLFQLAPDRIRVIGNGADLEPPDTPARDSRPAGDARTPDTSLPDARPARRYPGRPLLVFAGRLVHEKGLQELIKALPLLRDELPGLRLVVAGTGQQLADQQDRAARYGVADLIDWAGFLDAMQTCRAVRRRRPGGGALAVRAVRHGGAGGPAGRRPGGGLGHRWPGRAGGAGGHRRCGSPRRTRPPSQRRCGRCWPIRPQPAGARRPPSTGPGRITAGRRWPPVPREVYAEVLPVRPAGR